MDVTLKTTEEVERFFQETDNVLLGPPPKMKNAQIVFTEKAHTGKCILCCGEDVTLTGGKLVRWPRCHRLPGERKHLVAAGCNGACWMHVCLGLVDVHQRVTPCNCIRAAQCAYWRQRPFFL